MTDRYHLYEHGDRVGTVDLEDSTATYEGDDDFVRYVVGRVNEGYSRTVSGPVQENGRISVRREAVTGDELAALLEPLLDDVDGVRYVRVRDGQ